jgi:3-oxoacyl-[acyl-carrier protein] reductase
MALLSLPYSFNGKSVLVTGSSRGIGAALVAEFGRCGARCAINYVAAGQNKTDAEAVAASIPGSAVFECDVADAKAVERMMTEVERSFGGLDILINNAGILADRSLKKMSTVEWEKVISVNLTGTFNCLQQASARLRDGGRVVNISSVSAQLGFFGQANYAASKAGIVALTKVAAREMAGRRITVNVVSPGFINTDIHHDLPASVREEFVKKIPLGAFGEIPDVVFPVIFLCSSEAGYITGQVLHVNGGFYM